MTGENNPIANAYASLRNIVGQVTYNRDDIDEKIGDIDDYITSNHDNIYPSEIVNSVTDNDMRPVTSNAVYDAIDNVDIPSIVDNLTTNDATQVLSAKQGKTLNDSITSLSTRISGVESELSNLETDLLS